MSSAERLAAWLEGITVSGYSPATATFCADLRKVLTQYHRMSRALDDIVRDAREEMRIAEGDAAGAAALKDLERIVKNATR